MSSSQLPWHSLYRLSTSARANCLLLNVRLEQFLLRLIGRRYISWPLYPLFNLFYDGFSHDSGGRFGTFYFLDFNPNAYFIFQNSLQSFFQIFDAASTTPDYQTRPGCVDDDIEHVRSSFNFNPIHGHAL